MMVNYGVRVIHAFDNRRVGQVFFPPALLRDALLQRNLVERVLPPKEEPEPEQKRPRGRPPSRYY